MSHSFNQTGWCSGWKTLSVSPYFVCFRNAGFYVYSTLCDGRKRLHVVVCARYVCVCSSGQRKNGNYSADFSCFARWAVCAICPLHYEFIHTLGSAIIPWYEVSACTWPSYFFTFPLGVLSFTLIMFSRWALVAKSRQRVNEWVKLKAFSHKSCRGDDSSHMPCCSYVARIIKTNSVMFPTTSANLSAPSI